MGILNVTPDSFHDGGRYASPAGAAEAGLRMEADGADIIDVGGESSRPGANPTCVQEEVDRVLPVIERIRKQSGIPLSVDTTKADVAEGALDAGATIVNDVSALRFDKGMGKVVASRGAFIILMHMLGSPETMQKNPTYDDVITEIRSFLDERIRRATAAGIERDRVLVDPGLGFGKRLSHNLAIVRGLSRFTSLGLPVVVGLSRKSFLGEILGVSSNDRLEGTIAANTAAILNGANVIRVHDVLEGRRTADVAFRLREDGH
jgi:dihydropteroate synthase